MKVTLGAKLSFPSVQIEHVPPQGSPGPRAGHRGHRCAAKRRLAARPGQFGVDEQRLDEVRLGQLALQRQRLALSPDGLVPGGQREGQGRAGVQGLTGDRVQVVSITPRHGGGRRGGQRRQGRCVGLDREAEGAEVVVLVLLRVVVQAGPGVEGRSDHRGLEVRQVGHGSSPSPSSSSVGGVRDAQQGQGVERQPAETVVAAQHALVDGAGVPQARGGCEGRVLVPQVGGPEGHGVAQVRQPAGAYGSRHEDSTSVGAGVWS